MNVNKYVKIARELNEEQEMPAPLRISAGYGMLSYSNNINSLHNFCTSLLIKERGNYM